MNAVSRQRRTNARRIAHATADSVPLVAVSLPARTVVGLPTATRDRADAISGEPATLDLLSAEIPAGRALVALIATPAHGSAVLNDDATVTYTSLPGFVGGDSFGYRFTDERGRSSRVAVAVDVAPGGEPAGAHTALASAA